jgi:uncharacterized membrane protein (DUF2068 family)
MVATDVSYHRRPRRITALSLFFGAGAVISLTAAVGLLFPESFLQSMWRINPRALQAFHSMGPAAVALLTVVSVACGSTALGLWFGKLWGYYIAIMLLAVNLVGDIYNVVSGTEVRAAIGIPIVILVLVFITRPPTRAFFKNGGENVL